ncbi:DNA polymerase III subunit delta' [Argonema antarcticum]|uniref:DNA polymerase III subunit delta' n=1 Tax=Argonema antarcticum TaxID=2942763 RepID=UPI002012C99D|nr:DNA polymerase III subunit delta' [Argonema antarcticum]MCL1475658.1 AAA family ATPase [Argonema antarcticum A004/B2]
MEPTINLNHFSSIIGQPTAVKLLQAIIATNRIPNALLFVGEEGIGKRLAANCFIQSLFSDGQVNLPIEISNHRDILWVMPTYQHGDKLLTSSQAIAQGIKRKVPPVIRISQVREIVEFATSKPLNAPKKLVVIEDADALNHQAASALLKTLEEPANTLFILMANSIQTLLPTIISRCQVIPFRRLSDNDLATVLTQNGYSDILANPTLITIARGSPGLAIASHQMLQSIPPELLNQCNTLPNSLMAALSLARKIDRSLEYSQQLWLIDYLMLLWWDSLHRTDLMAKLESAKQALLKLAQTRLVWEVALVNCIQL